MNLSKVERQRNKKQLLITSSFHGLLAEKEESITPKGEIIIFDETDPARMVNELEQLRPKKGIRICIFDLAILPDDKAWTFVEDSINRSGTNPLRQLSGLSTTRFIDVGQLYLVPKGQTGTTILSLGARFKAAERGPIAICGHLHTMAVIAHAMNFKVTAIVVSEEKFKNVAFQEIERFC